MKDKSKLKAYNKNKIKKLTEKELLTIDGGGWFIDRLKEGYKKAFRPFAFGERKTYV